jgi:hypothetical protein
MNEQQWYYAECGEQRGPVPAETLKQMLSRGDLPTDTLVWRDGMADWVSAATVAELQLPVAVPVVPPPPSMPAPPALEPVAQPPAWLPPPPTSFDAGVRRDGPYPNVQGPMVDPNQGRELAIASMILGIVSIPGACLACIGFITGVLAIVFAVMNTNPAHASKAKAGLICGIIGATLSLGTGFFGTLGRLLRP